METKKNITYISCLQIIGPILVILGHSLNGMEASGFWYIFSKELIYFFHMPLFFMISGYLLSHNGWQKNKSYGQFIKNKFQRLIVPYLFWNILCLIPKMLLQAYITDSVSTNLWLILKAFVYPRQNIWGHTWFLVGLFLLYLLTPLWKKLFSSKEYLKYLCLFFGVVLYCLPLKSELLCISDLHKDLLFFLVGLFLGTVPDKKFLSAMQKTKYLWLVLAIASSTVFLYWFEPLTMLQFLPAFFILMALLSFSCTIKTLPEKAIERSKLSFGIYIMHWPVMLACRVLFYQILGCNMIVTVVTMIAAGYYVPLLLIWLLRKIPSKKIKRPLHILLGV